MHACLTQEDDFSIGTGMIGLKYVQSLCGMEHCNNCVTCSCVKKTEDYPVVQRGPVHRFLTLRLPHMYIYRHIVSVP